MCRAPSIVRCMITRLQRETNNIRGFECHDDNFTEDICYSQTERKCRPTLRAFVRDGYVSNWNCPKSLPVYLKYLFKLLDCCSVQRAIVHVISIWMRVFTWILIGFNVLIAKIPRKELTPCCTLRSHQITIRKMTIQKFCFNFAAETRKLKTETCVLGHLGGASLNNHVAPRDQKFQIFFTSRWVHRMGFYTIWRHID